MEPVTGNQDVVEKDNVGDVPEVAPGEFEDNEGVVQE